MKGRVVITPHAGEMASLLDCSREAVEAEPRGDRKAGLGPAWGRGGA
jgi:NAD(P)H-hydrate repair Nnr-like enzyme with NAD(P)H-hydrate dehydratase domain